MEDIYLKVENAYVQLMWSDNEPYDENAKGVIGIYVYDENGQEHQTVEGGELDVFDDLSLMDHVHDALDFIGVSSRDYQLLSEEEFEEIMENGSLDK